MNHEMGGRVKDTQKFDHVVYGWPLYRAFSQILSIIHLDMHCPILIWNADIFVKKLKVKLWKKLFLLRNVANIKERYNFLCIPLKKVWKRQNSRKRWKKSWFFFLFFSQKKTIFVFVTSRCYLIRESTTVKIIYLILIPRA